MWDERYRGSDFHYGTQPNTFLRDHWSAIRPGGRVLCLAEGEGRNAVFLARQGFRVTAMDQSAVGMDKASKLARSQGVEIETIVGDLAGFSFGGPWDGIVSIFAHTPPALRRRLHRETVATLAPGGVFILEAFTPRQPEMPGRGGPPAAQKALLMSWETLREELDGLSFEVGREADRDLDEGAHHGGRCAVVQVLGRKVALA